MRPRRIRCGLVVLAVGIAATACSVPTDETAEAIDAEQLPDSLRPDFTTTTTSTLPPAPVSETATVYLLRHPPETERRLVVPVEREVPLSSSLSGVLSTLFGPEVTTEEEQELGFSNALFELDLLSATVEDEVAIIDIVPLTPEGEPSEEPFTGDLIGAAAQLVWTATEYTGVTGVRILINGEEVPIPTNTADIEAGEILDRSHYERFDPDVEDVIEDVTTTTTAPASTTTQADSGAQG